VLLNAGAMSGTGAFEPSPMPRHAIAEFLQQNADGCWRCDLRPEAKPSAVNDAKEKLQRLNTIHFQAFADIDTYQNEYNIVRQCLEDLPPDCARYDRLSAKLTSELEMLRTQLMEVLACHKAIVFAHALMSVEYDRALLDTVHRIGDDQPLQPSVEKAVENAVRRRPAAACSDSGNTGKRSRG